MNSKKKTKELTTRKTHEELRKEVSGLFTVFDPNCVIRDSESQLKLLENGKRITSDTDMFRALSLFEFDKGVLMAMAIPELSQSFALEFSRNLQKEHQCNTQAEKSLCEIIAINFVRVLEIQRKVNSRYNQQGLGKIDIEYLAVLSKELDKAQGHYLKSLQLLKTFKQPNLEVNINANTALIAQNQMIKSETNGENISISL